MFVIIDKLRRLNNQTGPAEEFRALGLDAIEAMANFGIDPWDYNTYTCGYLVNGNDGVITLVQSYYYHHCVITKADDNNHTDLVVAVKRPNCRHPWLQYMDDDHKLHFKLDDDEVVLIGPTPNRKLVVQTRYIVKERRRYNR